MIKKSLAAVGRAARDLFRRRGALLLLAALYFAALWCAYQFFATGVATGWQLFVSAATALFAPLFFFIWQAGVANYAAGALSAGAVAKRALRDFWKVLLVTLPLVALGVGLCYLLDWLHGRLPAETAPPPPIGVRGARPPLQGWGDWLVSTLELLAFGAVLPLLAAHLWIEVARRGLKATLRGLHRVAARAFAPRSVLVYAVGALFFGVLPYFLIFSLPPILDGWAELSIFGIRQALVFALTLSGWVMTTTALAEVSTDADQAGPAVEEAEAAPRTEPAVEQRAETAVEPSAEPGAPPAAFSSPN
jgi:hypothetical protein